MSGTASEVTWLLSQQRHCWSAVRQHPTVFSLPNVTAGQLSDTTSNGLFTAQRHCWSAVSLLISCLTTGQLSHTTSNGLFYCPTLLLVSCQTHYLMVLRLPNVTAGQLSHYWSAVLLQVNCQSQHRNVLSVAQRKTCPNPQTLTPESSVDY